MDLINDEKIMLSVKSGDIESLATLFEKYHVKLYNFFLRMTRNKEISKDLTQEVFQRILRYKHTYDPDWKFTTWMFQIARNSANKYYSANKILTSDFQTSETVRQEEISAIDEMEMIAKKESLYEALSQLNEDQREIIELARFQGMKYKEIAELTNNSVAAVKVKVHRAINRLRELYFELA